MLKPDETWEPSKELSPHEARAFWLEKEVVALKQSLAKMTNGNPFRSCEYWSKGFHPATGPPEFKGFPEEPTDLGRPDPNLAERISRLHPGDAPGQLRGGSGEPALQDRARMDMDDGEVQRHLLGRSGDHALLGRARSSMGGGEVPRPLLGGSGEDPLQARACTTSMGQGDFHGHLLGGRHADLGDDRALHGGGGDGLHQVGGAASLLPGRQGGFCGVGGHDGGGVGMIPQSWETGGGGNTRAELPELPGLASPLQFGDWIHLCGPVMRDLSSVASRWWDLTVRQAQVYYADWKQATPLQRVQIQPTVPDELQDRCYGRTEQRGVHLLLKAVAADVQQVLVTDRQMTSTAILFRLYVRYQPGGPGEKSLILKELTQLQKSNTMAELSAALRSWRRHFGRAREVGATLPDGTLLLRALEPAVQHVAKENSQAAFRLAQSRSALQVDEQPQPSTIWAFSQCLLAEAETLVLLNSSATSLSESPPLKLKIMEANDTGAPMKPQSEGSSSGKGRGGSTADVPCRWFKSDAGCRAGKQCKWSHSWDGISKTPGAGTVGPKNIQAIDKVVPFFKKSLDLVASKLSLEVVPFFGKRKKTLVITAQPCF